MNTKEANKKQLYNNHYASSKESVDILFKRYLEICNQAIAKNKDRFPYSQLIAIGEKVLNEQPIHLVVYDDEPKGDYSVVFAENTLTSSDEESNNPKKGWRMNLSYLREVVDNPDKYREHPEKIDLDWFKSRLGL